MNRAPFFACIGLHAPALIERIAGELQERHGLAPVFTSRQLTVLGDESAAHLRLPASEGVVWGHVFEREAGARMGAGDARLATTASDNFLERFWGGYVAIRAREDSIEVLRDPSGSVACYHAASEGVHFVTSRPDYLFELKLLSPSIDWTILAQALVYRDLRPARTALRGISEVLPGVLLRIEDGQAQASCAWSPWRFAATDSAIADSQTATSALASSARTTLEAWGRAFERPLIEISGGLDSAIVAAGLRAVSPAAECLTFGPIAGDPDERPWARAIARHLEFPLHELTLDIAGVDVTRSDASHLPRPCARLFSQALDRPIQQLARSVGADAFLGGGGGDSIFCLLLTALVVNDRISRDGLGRGMFETAANIGELSQTNAWKVLAAALRRLAIPPSPRPTPLSNSFLRPHVAHALPWPTENPWLDAPPDIPPAKRRHAWSILSIHNHLEGYGREDLAPYLSPLLSQPMLETCLRIPTWLWCAGGRNRAVARDAFRDRLPVSVIERRTKGAFNRFVTAIFEANRPSLRDMLLGGALAREGLIDEAAVAACLEGQFPQRDALSQYMALIDFEAWIGAWEGRSFASG